MELFAAHGYDPIAPGWPGDAATAAETRADPDAVAGYGVGDVTDHYSKIISGLSSPPVVIGHSFGGLIAQRLHGMGFARACIALAPAQFTGILGLPLVQLQSAWPVLSHPGLRTRAGRTARTASRRRSPTPSRGRSPTSCWPPTESPRRPARCSRQGWPTSRRTARPRSTPRANGVRCC
jgi:alpha-beta hydrolase superfamily lysophospholipase